ncbi:uncharacterized protein LOC135121492 [Zophobas morio]|uniref:uncharacterized protein LOC135121492 n=1 Tax=Zophobas morio TaxID=2755281 RepID=UPI00308350B9
MIPAVNSSRLPTRCKSSSANSCTASHKQAVTNNLKALKVQANLSRERDQIKDKEPTSNVSISNIFSEKGRTRILPADAHKGSLTSSTQRGNYLKKEAINVEEVLLKENKILKETSDKFLEHMKVCKLELIKKLQKENDELKSYASVVSKKLQKLEDSIEEIVNRHYKLCNENEKLREELDEAKSTAQYKVNSALLEQDKENKARIEELLKLASELNEDKCTISKLNVI